MIWDGDKESSTDKAKDPISLCFHLLKYILEVEKATQNLRGVICNLSDAVEIHSEIFSSLLERNLQSVRQWRRKWTPQELRLDAQVHDYDLKNVLLDLGYNVNIMLKKSWEGIGSLNLFYSPI